MCEKAEEMQKNTPQDGVGGTFLRGNIMCHHQSNWAKEHGGAPEGIYWFMDEEYIERCPTCDNEEPHRKTIKCIWLPRQDQLQEMVKYQFYSLLELCWGFAQSKNGWGFDSMEQLWLAFVMKEKYGKVWVKDDWVKEITNPVGFVDEFHQG